MKTRFLLFAGLITAFLALTVISFAQRKPENEKPITGDFKITSRVTAGGQSSQSTTMIRGARQRDETSNALGAGQINITQCDLKRTIQINDSLRKYLITPFGSPDPATTSGSGGNSGGSDGMRRGGVVTMTVNTVDTGERKELFGFTARHLKRTTVMQSSPEACQQQQMKIETDGWYINLEYGLNCGSDQWANQSRRTTATGCQDRYQYNTTGPSRLGFPLIETTTMYGADGRAMFSSTKEVVELSRQTMDAALFDVPPGYIEAKSQEEMYGQPSTAGAMSQEPSGQASSASNSSQSSTAGMPASATSRVKVGVVEFNNKTKTALSTDSLREQLVATLNGNGIDAIALNASSPNEVAIEARAKGCSYVLYTDVAALKSASGAKKLGGLFGRATGVGSADSGKSEARFDFRLIQTDGASPVLQSSASGKEDTQEASVNAALQSEAMAVTSAVNKR